MENKSNLIRVEDERLMAGRGKFTDTAFKNDDLYAYIVRSEKAHIIIKNIDTKNAKLQSGVELVITGDEAKEFWEPISPTMDLLDLKLQTGMQPIR